MEEICLYLLRVDVNDSTLTQEKQPPLRLLPRLDGSRRIGAASVEFIMPRWPREPACSRSNRYDVLAPKNIEVMTAKQSVIVGPRSAQNSPVQEAVGASTMIE